tara:strand:+ start:6721 stop:6942 length:222 start_codon:yes stop_codon:yes gene_type:complete
MDSPVHAELFQWCGAKALHVENGLIQNTNPMTLKKAKQANEKLVLRWRIRVCESCQESFDIANQGLFYECKRC